MMRYSCALALVLAVSFTVSSEGFRLKHEEQHNVAVGPHRDTEELSLLQEEEVGEQEDELQGTDDVASLAEKEETGEEQDEEAEEEEEEEAGEEEPDAQDVEKSSFVEEEQAGQAELAEQDAEEPTFVEEESDEQIEEEEHDDKQVEEPYFVQEEAIEESFAQEDAAETDSGFADVGPANVDIANIVRSDFKNWYIVKDGRAVNQNIEGKYVSAKPRNIDWDRIGSWDYSRSSTKTNPLIKVKLNGSNGARVKLELAFRFIYGGRVGEWPAHPELRNKGRFLKKVRVVPYRYVANGYSLNARVSQTSVGRTGTRTDPVAEVKLKIRIQGGKKGDKYAKWYKSVWEITVKGTGHHSARKLSR